MKGPGLTDAAVFLVAAVGAVQLVVAPLRHRVAHRRSRVAAGRQRSLPRQAAGELVLTAAPAALLVLAGLGAVPFPVAALLLGEAAARRAATPALPRRAVAAHVERGFEAGHHGAGRLLEHQRHEAGVGLHFERFVIKRTGDLFECRNTSKYVGFLHMLPICFIILCYYYLCCKLTNSMRTMIQAWDC